MADLFLALNPYYLGIGQIYQQYYYFIDSIIALVLFVAISNWVFARKYGKEHDGHKVASKESKLIAIAVGLALTVAFAVFELQTGFNFGKLSPLAVIVLLVVLGIFLYELLVAAFGDDRKACAFAFVYLILYGLFMSAKSETISQLFQEYRLVWGILAIGFLAAFFKFIMCIIGMFTNGGKSDEHGEAPHGAESPPGSNQPQTPAPPGHPPTQGMAINIVVPTPGQKIHGNEHLHVEGTIVGGTPSFEWIAVIDGSQNMKGVGDHIHCEFEHVAAGRHILTVTAQDSKGTRAQEAVEFVVEGHEEHDTKDLEKHIDNLVQEAVAVAGWGADLNKYSTAWLRTAATPNAPTADLMRATDAFGRAAHEYRHANDEFVKALQTLAGDAHIEHMPPELAQKLGRAMATVYSTAVHVDQQWSQLCETLASAQGGVR